jgi:hypothetical protein
VAREDDGRAARKRVVVCVEGILATEENGEVDNNPGHA